MPPHELEHSPGVPTARPLRIERLDPQVVEILRRMTPAQRIEQMFEMNAFVRENVTAQLQHQHPDWSPEQVHRALLQRLGYESA
jgi:hypothetical protein